MTRTEEGDEVPLNPTSLEHEAYAWVVRFGAGKGNLDDIKALKAWAALSEAHAQAFDQASRTWKAIDASARDLLLMSVTAPDSAAQRIGTSIRRERRAFIGGAIAASLAGTIGLAARPPLDLWPSWSELTADYRTRTGEQRRLDLADNISVEMNTQTSIALRPSNQDGSQIELLTGEAFVTAARASGGLTVIAGEGRVFAENSIFNVRRDTRGVCVTCLQGNIRVKQQTTDLPVTAGQQVSYSDRGIEASTIVDSAAVTAWKDGVIVFQATPIHDVISEVNRYRHGTIILTNSKLGNRRFNARFRIANIDEVIGQIEQIFGAKATNLPGGITLLG